MIFVTLVAPKLLTLGIKKNNSFVLLSFFRNFTAMKILHTSDWHLGHVLYHYDREEEQTAFLLQLEQIVRQEQPDALLVSGDVFHTPAPSAATVKMYVSAMLALRSACPTMAIVVIAGNHDSASRIDCDRDLWRVAGITVVGTVARGADDAVARHIIPVHDAGRQLLGTIVAVPHCYRLPADTFFADLLAMADRSRPVVLMAHLTMTGSDITGHDNIGMLDSVPPARVAGYDYVALGHIHRPQFIAGGDRRVRYCGTPVAVSFDEQCEHSVSLVTLNGHDAPQVRTIAIGNVRPLLTIPASEPLPFSQALQQLEASTDRRPCYIRLNVLADDPLPVDAHARAARVAQAHGYRFCTMRVTSPQRDEREQFALSAQQLQALSPVDVAQRYVSGRLGRDLTERERQMLHFVLKQIDEEDHA